jgi:hypothetical protein
MRKLFKKPVPSKDELYIRDIVEKYLEDSSVIKMVTPLTRVCYLVNKSEQVHIRLDSNNVDICNHDFYYRKSISGDFSTKLQKAIIKKVEEEIVEVNKELFHNEIDLLRNIFNYQ